MEMLSQETVGSILYPALIRIAERGKQFVKGDRYYAHTSARWNRLYATQFVINGSLDIFQSLYIPNLSNSVLFHHYIWGSHLFTEDQDGADERRYSNGPRELVWPSRQVFSGRRNSLQLIPLLQKLHFIR